jgi:hypothetical protein
MMKDLTTIAVQKDTQKRLSDMKIVKKPGHLENYDDVIRRKMNLDAPEEKA